MIGIVTSICEPIVRYVINRHGNLIMIVGLAPRRDMFCGFLTSLLPDRLVPIGGRPECHGTVRTATMIASSDTTPTQPRPSSTVEPLTYNQEIGGSSPPRGAKLGRSKGPVTVRARDIKMGYETTLIRTSANLNTRGAHKLQQQASESRE